jgi:hypothetical protein
MAANTVATHTRDRVAVVARKKIVQDPLSHFVNTHRRVFTV